MIFRNAIRLKFRMNNLKFEKLHKNVRAIDFDQTLLFVPKNTS